MCEDESLAVYCHVFTGNSWTENTANWNNVDVDNYGLLLSSKTVSYNNGAALPTPHRYSFNILDAVQGWKNNTYNIDKGILFKAFSTIENGTTYIKKTFSSFNRSTYNPSLSITYVLESKAISIIQNMTPVNLTTLERSLFMAR